MAAILSQCTGGLFSCAQVSVDMKLFILEISNPSSVVWQHQLMHTHIYTYMRKPHLFRKGAEPKDCLWEAHQHTAQLGEPSTSGKLTLL